MLGGGLPGMREELIGPIGGERQRRLDITDDVIDRVVGAKGIVPREAVGAVSDAIGADDDGAERHPFQRGEVKTLGLMRQE